MTTERIELPSVEQQLWNQALRQISDPIMAAHVLELFTQQPDFQRTYPGVYLMAKTTIAHHEKNVQKRAALKLSLIRFATWLKSLLPRASAPITTPRVDPKPAVSYGQPELDPV
ncbi:hypothetical protein KBW71_07635 [Hydrogenophaga aromaticivorans]|uniref:hypothetical protein n=1 Tax=Hydrogenophaga aromaticivorans TaxID=2610898 RepID=UPI001B389A98|nr:hypothetical protein [Hydrogenophaga aromaticivorans]MBQ0918313.1 hypothetical protein [Hydrogenophaga aromaticivorans]